MDQIVTLSLTTKSINFLNTCNKSETFFSTSFDFSNNKIKELFCWLGKSFSIISGSHKTWLGRLSNHVNNSATILVIQLQKTNICSTERHFTLTFYLWLLNSSFHLWNNVLNYYNYIIIRNLLKWILVKTQYLHYFLRGPLDGCFFGCRKLNSFYSFGEIVMAIESCHHWQTAQDKDMYYQGKVMLV